MVYEVNDTVLYGGGICRIAEIKEKEMNNTRREYYVLNPVYDEKTVIYIPVSNKIATAKMRQLLSVEEVQAITKAIPNESTIWIDNENDRRDRYREIITQGDRMELAQLIRTLYLHQRSKKEKGQKVHAADERLMKEAEKILYEEFAYVLNIDLEQVEAFITAQNE